MGGLAFTDIRPPATAGHGAGPGPELGAVPATTPGATSIAPNATPGGHPTEPVPLVFLHGAGWAGVSWHRQVAEFRHERRCIVIDLPGHGASRDIPWTTFDDVADQVADVIAEQVGSPVDLVGFSLGGDIGIRLLARHPALIRTAMLTGVSTSAVPRAERLFEALTWPFVATPLVHRILTDAMKLDAGTRRRHLRETAPLRIADYRLLSAQVLHGADVSDLSGVETPVLVLAGACESGHARRSAPDLAAHLPRAVWAEVSGAGHSWHVQRPDVFNLALRQWLADPGTVPRVLRTS
ncbi:pimeloyl-ACP methyl ester carboxylesterase [Microbacterium resistens]|uniref:Pimeloyl-ACP methyl ester carboxylesterase n=1 Tax=Microbacterium resistens TaxID=156977 RepID=A0ABU1SBS2_9MICO|nr:alpha/beta hydrolase [Microbacterium resistens]MDR6867069.1 pimeloyl-ACP methyl ester carboxylesterase [Microbacterium resistens]